MNTYTFQAVVGVKEAQGTVGISTTSQIEGTPILKTFEIQAENWSEARHKLTELVEASQE